MNNNFRNIPLFTGYTGLMLGASLIFDQPLKTLFGFAAGAYACTVIVILLVESFWIQEGKGAPTNPWQDHCFWFTVYHGFDETTRKIIRTRGLIALFCIWIAFLVANSVISEINLKAVTTVVSVSGWSVPLIFLIQKIRFSKRLDNPY